MSGTPGLQGIRDFLSLASQRPALACLRWKLPHKQLFPLIVSPLLGTFHLQVDFFRVLGNTDVVPCATSVTVKFKFSFILPLSPSLWNKGLQ